MQGIASAFELALSSGSLRELFSSLNPEDCSLAAALALSSGYPALAAEHSADRLVQAAAFLRLGQPDNALTVLEPLSFSARTAVLQARAEWQRQRPEALPRAEQARKLARQEGDAGAIVASAALLGEMQLHEPKQALRTLAEGLKVAEMVNEKADAYLLAVLAHAQARAGGAAKAARTAEKALNRSLERSPARVVALLALNRAAEAKDVASAGELGELWFRPFQEFRRQEG